jgi:hypothetical protein
VRLRPFLRAQLVTDLHEHFVQLLEQRRLCLLLLVAMQLGQLLRQIRHAQLHDSANTQTGHGQD